MHLQDEEDQQVVRKTLALPETSLAHGQGYFLTSCTGMFYRVGFQTTTHSSLLFAQLSCLGRCSNLQRCRERKG